MTPSWKTLRIFISSTFRDMHAERDHLVRFVFPRLRETLLTRRIHLVDVDLRWGVTSEQNSVAVCREVVDECHPRFMGVLGGRYGWVPPEGVRSITEDEVHYGVLERDAEVRGNAFFYFRDEETTASMVEKMAGDFREPPGSENAKRLAELKQSIVDAGLPVFRYSARWNPIQERLTGLEAFGEHVYAHLLKNIQDDPELTDCFAGDTTAPSDEFTEEREAMEAFIENRTQRYVVGSRQALLEKIIAFAAASGEPNVLVIEGEPGSGKSSLLGKLCQLLATQGPNLLISHFVGASVGSTNLRLTLHRLCHEIWREFGSFFQTAKASRLAEVLGENEEANAKREAIEQEYVLPEDTTGLILAFNRWLKWIPNERHLILVIDAVNQFDTADRAHDMHWLPEDLPPNIRIIVSALEHPVLDALRRRGEPVRIEKLELLSAADAFEIIGAFLQRYSKRFSREQIAALLAKPESRLPLYVLTALEELRTLGTYEEITARIQLLPGEAKALFIWILKERLSSDPGFCDMEDRSCGAALVTKLASCLGVSRHGLSQEELIGLIDPGDPLGNVAALLRLLRPYLMHRGELIDLFHKQLREAIEDEYLNSVDLRLRGHQLLANYFHNVADPNREGHWLGTSAHALSELPYHQVRASAWPELVATLESISFLEAKVAHGMTFDLTLNFLDAISHVPIDHPHHRILKLLEEALCRDIPGIARHARDYPQALFQCLWNSAWWYDCSDAAFHYEAPVGGWKLTPPWGSEGTYPKLSTLLQRWRTERETNHPGFFWLRSLHPPVVPLGVGQLAIVRGHAGGVNSVAFSPDGRRFLSGSGDETVRLWGASSGLELAVFRGQVGGVDSVAFSPDGRRILSGCGDGTVRLWDVESGCELFVMRGHHDPVNSVAFSPDGRRILSGSGAFFRSWDFTVRLWAAESGRELAVFHGHEGKVTSVAFSPDGRLILSGGNIWRLWDASSGLELAVFRGQVGGVGSVAFSPDGRRFLSGCGDGTVRLWDAESRRELAVFRGHENQVNSVAFSPDGHLIVSGSGYSTAGPVDNTVRLWDAESGHELAVFHGHEGLVTSVAFSPDGRHILSGSADKSVRLWDAECRHELAVLRGHKSRVMCVAFSPDDHRIVSGSGDSLRSRDNTLRLWDAESGRELAVFRGHEELVSRVAFSPDGRHIVSGSADKTVRLWDAGTGRELVVFRGHEEFITGVAFSPDGRYILSGSKDTTVRLWDTESGRVLTILRGHTEAVWCVAFSPDGRFILSGSEDFTVRPWDGISGGELAVLYHEYGGEVNDVAFSPDGRQMASGSQAGVVRLWSAGARQEPAVLEAIARVKMQSHFTFDELNAASGRELAILRVPYAVINSVAFSSDGRRIISHLESGETLIWDVETGRCLNKAPGDCHTVDDPTSGSVLWHASVESGETLIRSSPGAEPEARFFEALPGIQSESSSRTWADGLHTQLVLLRLEGGGPGKSD